MVQKYTSLEDVIELARYAHRNQRDKAGMPYFDHPERVMKAVQAQGAFPYVQMAAVLHDVTEDTAFTTDMLITLGVPEAAVNLVKLLDRHASAKKYDGIDEWRQRAIDNGNLERAGHYSSLVHFQTSADDFYYEEIRRNKDALMIKLSDIHDNTQLWRLVYLPVPTQERLKDKYDKAVKKLTH